MTDLSDEEKAPSNGTWIANADVHPTTNIAGRRFRTTYGREFTYFPGIVEAAFRMDDLSNPERIAEWFFPEDQQEATK